MESRDIVESVTSEFETPRRPRSENRPEGPAARQQGSARLPLTDPPRSSSGSHTNLSDEFVVHTEFFIQFKAHVLLLM